MTQKPGKKKKINTSGAILGKTGGRRLPPDRPKGQANQLPKVKKITPKVRGKVGKKSSTRSADSMSRRKNRYA